MYTQDEFASFTRKQEEEAQVVSFAFHTPTPCQPERNDIAHSLLTDDNGTPATWTMVLFQQAIDRQDRTS